MKLTELKRLCEESPWARQSGRLPTWGDAEEILALQTLPRDEKFFISCCWESRQNSEIDLEMRIPANLRNGRDWVDENELGTPVALSDEVFYCLMAWDDDGDFIVTTSPFPWAFFKSELLLSPMKNIMQFSYSRIDFLREVPEGFRG